MVNKPKIRIVVLVEGGIVQEVFHEVNEQKVQVVVVDRDVDMYVAGENVVDNIDGAPAALDVLYGEVDREFVAEVCTTADVLLERSLL